MSIDIFEISSKTILRFVIIVLILFQRLWPSLNHGLKESLGDKYTKEVNEAWKKLYMYICYHMKRGMENPDMDLEGYSVYADR